MTSDDRLGHQAVLHTGPDGQCTLTLSDNSLVIVRPNSRIRLLEINNNTLFAGLRLKLQVEEGSVENVVTPRQPGGRYDVLTPLGIATVRGTHFMVSTQNQTMRTEVLQGQVNVGNAQGRAVLPPGTGTVVTEGHSPTRAQPLLAPPDVTALPRQIGRFPQLVPLPITDQVHAYQAQWKVHGSDTALLSEPVSTPLTLLGTHLPDGNHVLRVRAVDAQGLQGLPADVPVQVHLLPDPPIYLSPPPKAVLSTNQPSIAWTQGTPPRVRLQVSAEPSFQAPWVDTVVTNDGQTTLLRQISTGEWYWRLASVTPNGEAGPWGPTEQLTRLPDAPQTQPPQAENDRFVLRWQPVAGAHSYEVELRTPDTTAPPQMFPVEGDATLPLPADLAAGEHAIRVRAQLANGLHGDWSAPQRFTVPQRWALWPWALLLVLPLLP